MPTVEHNGSSFQVDEDGFLLKGMEEQEKIKIHDLIVDYCSYRFEWNSSTIVHWTKKKNKFQN